MCALEIEEKKWNLQVYLLHSIVPSHRAAHIIPALGQRSGAGLVT